MKKLFLFSCLATVLFACGSKSSPEQNQQTDSTNQQQSAFNNIGEIDAELKKSPNNADLWYTRGIMNHDLGDLSSAIHDFSEAIKYNSNYVSAYHDRGICKHELEDYEGALSDYSKALELDSSFSEAYYNRAMVYDIQNNREKALKDYDQAIRYKPDFAAAYYNRGVYYYNFDCSKACEDFKKASDLGDKDGEKAYLDHCQK